MADVRSGTVDIGSALVQDDVLVVERIGLSVGLL